MTVTGEADPVTAALPEEDDGHERLAYLDDALTSFTRPRPAPRGEQRPPPSSPETRRDAPPLAQAPDLDALAGRVNWAGVMGSLIGLYDMIRDLKPRPIPPGGRSNDPDRIRDYQQQTLRWALYAAVKAAEACMLSDDT